MDTQESTKISWYQHANSLYQIRKSKQQSTTETEIFIKLYFHPIFVSVNRKIRQFAISCYGKVDNLQMRKDSLP